jgi:hypothetical protein
MVGSMATMWPVDERKDWGERAGHTSRRNARIEEMTKKPNKVSEFCGNRGMNRTIKE